MKKKLTESEKEGEIMISISKNIEFHSKSVLGYEKDNFIIIKMPIHIIILNVHAHNNTPSKYMKAEPVCCKKK